MQQLDRLRRPRLASILALALAFTPGAALADAWVDNGLQPVRPADWVKVARPQPVQLLFEFQTNGATNVRGTALLRRQVAETVRASGLFSQVSEAPVAGGAILHVVIDDLADEKARAAAERQGFTDHSTFGLVGAMVPEVYEARLDFIPGPGALAITRSARHKIWGQIGLRRPSPRTPPGRLPPGRRSSP